MKTLGIRFVFTGKPIAVIIRRWQLGWWAAHVDLVARDGTYLGAHAITGVKKRPIGYDDGFHMRDLIVSIPCTDSQYEMVQDFCHDQIGKSYDVGAIFMMATGLPWFRGKSWRDEDNWFCSELIAAALSLSNLLVLPSRPNVVTPRDLAFALGRYMPYNDNNSHS